MRKKCEGDNEISKVVIDDFLIYYAARRNRFDIEFEARSSRFSQLKKEMPTGWVGLAKAQYVAHRIFMEGGVINQYLNHSAIKNLSGEEQVFLRRLSTQPWRFSFSEIKGNPAPDFFEMEDVFTGKSFLLYSKSITQILSEQSVALWFNLIGFNGECWQTFGPVVDFQSFDADDIFFYASEVNASITSAEDLVNDLAHNPVPYMMLFARSNYPIIMHGAFEMVQLNSEANVASFDLKAMKKQFHVEHAGHVIKMSHKVWSEFPHHAEAFYDESKKIIVLSAHTDRGYTKMTILLNKSGFNLADEAEIRVHFPMLNVIKDLLKKDVDINPYRELFAEAIEEEDDEETYRLNKFLAMALPALNAGKEPNINALAKKAGVDPAIARAVIISARRGLS